VTELKQRPIVLRSRRDQPVIGHERLLGHSDRVGLGRKWLLTECTLGRATSKQERGYEWDPVSGHIAPQAERTEPVKAMAKCYTLL
jgi:hypothetical protein